MGDEADRLTDLEYDEFDLDLHTYCCWCKAPIILMLDDNGYKPFNEDGTPHKCPEVNLDERRLSADAIINRIKLNF